MADRTISVEAKNLIKARDLISDKDHWTQGALRTSFHHKNGGTQSYCAVGALMQVSGAMGLGRKRQNWDQYNAALKPLAKAASDLFKTSIVDVNDTKGHDAVMSMYDTAISTALQKKRTD